MLHVVYFAIIIIASYYYLLNSRHTDIGKNSTNSTPLLDQDIQSSKLNLSNITCTEGYYLSASGVCRPVCLSWVEPAKIEFTYIAVVATIVIGLLSSIILILLALTVQRRTMYVSNIVIIRF